MTCSRLRESVFYTYTPAGKTYTVPRMKTKLTVTIDEALVPHAKQYARGQGLSLSELIERMLREVSAGERPSFSERWRGTFQPAHRDDERYRSLARKYL